MFDMTENFIRCHAFTAKWEGYISDDSADRGGLTKYGVSTLFLEDLARRRPEVVSAIGIRRPLTKDSIRGLTKDQAARLFMTEFWIPLACDSYHVAVALCVYDMAVNHGSAGSVRICQKACNERGKVLAVDGILGPNTRRALLGMASAEGLEAIASARQRYYDAIVRKRPSQQVFHRGWSNRCEDMLVRSVDMLSGRS